jgi:hypothetical protein
VVRDEFDYFIMGLEGDQHGFGGGDASTDLSAILLTGESGPADLQARQSFRLISAFSKAFLSA